MKEFENAFKLLNLGIEFGQNLIIDLRYREK